MVLFSSSAGKYVRYVSEGGGGELNRILAAKGGQVTGPHSKFEVVPSAVHPTMVHIRCSYNNRFLRRRSDSEQWIVAAADEPVDDLPEWSCTLFQPEILANGSVRLLHVQLGRYAEWYNDDDSTHPYSMCIWAQPTSPAEARVEFRVTDWETLVLWPSRLAFGGDNGAFLGIFNGPIEFYFMDPTYELAAHQVEVLPNPATIRVKNVWSGKYWKRHDDDIIHASDDNTTTPPSPDSVFTVVKVSNKIIALRNMGNNQFCRRDFQNMSHYFRANESEITDKGRLVLTEPLASRRIEDIKFHLDDAWVHNVDPGVVLQDGQPVSNETDETQTIVAQIFYEDKSKSTWRATNTDTSFRPVWPIEVEIRPDEIPYVTGPSTIEMAAPPVPSYVWGETTDELRNQARAHEVTLPPWTTATVKLSATVATCGVPLTYTRYDIFNESEGAAAVHIMEDGVYTGTNYFDFKFRDSAPQPIIRKKTM